MYVVSDGPFILKGYTRLTHEGIQFEPGMAKEVPDHIGEWLLGTYPLSFRQVEVEQVYPTTEISEPPIDRMMLPQRKRGRPKGHRR